MTGMSPAVTGLPQVSELISLESEEGEKLWVEEAARAELFRRVAGELEEHALLCCAVRGRRGEVADQRTDLGLVGDPPPCNLVPRSPATPTASPACARLPWEAALGPCCAAGRRFDW